MVLKKIIYFFVPILLIAFSSLPVSAEVEGLKDGITLTSWGQGPKTLADVKAPPDVKTAKDKNKETAGELTDEKKIEGSAVKNALLIYLLETLSPAEFEWLEEGIDSIILSSPEKFVLKTKVVSSATLPAAKYEIVKMEVTLNSNLLETYIGNVRKLKPMPKGPAPPTTSEKESFRSRGNEIFMQGEVGSNIVLDHARGIEAFNEAKRLYEKAGYDEGVLLALLSMGRTKLGIGDISGASADLKKALELSDAFENDKYRVKALLETARLHLSAGECKKALETASLALKISSSPTAGEVPGALLGEALLIIGKANYLLGNRDGGKVGVDRSADVFQKLGDLKRLNDALITLSIMRISTGEASGAIEEIKLCRKISEALKDDESRIVSLIMLGRALRETGELNGAKIYATEAKTAAKKAKWTAGEAMANMELSRISTAGNDYSSAISLAVEALELSIATDSSTLISTAHWTLGLAQLGAGKKEEALRSFDEVFRYHADTMAAELGGIYLPIETIDLNGLSEVLTDIVLLSEELGEEEAAFSALISYHGIWFAQRRYLSDSLFDERRGKLLSLWRKNIEGLLATERILISMETNRYSESSTKILLQRREDLKSSHFETRKTIVKENPSLAILLGMEKRVPKRLAREIGENSIFIQYFVGRDAAFALVTSKNDLKIVRLDDGPEKIKALSNHMAGLLSGEAKENNAVPADENMTLAHSLNLSFEETSRHLHAALMTPVLSRHPNVKKIGVSPGIALSPLNFLALGDYRGKGAFTFLIEDYDLFYAPSLFAAVSTAENTASTLDYLTVVGEGRFSPVEVRWLFYEVVSVDDTIPAGGETVRVINNAAAYQWWKERSPLIIVLDSGSKGSRRNGMGENSFFTMELFASYRNRPCIFIFEAAGKGEITATFETAVPRMRETDPLSGYFSTIRESAARYRDSGSLSWINFPIMCGF